MQQRNIVVIGGGFAGSTLVGALAGRLPRDTGLVLLSRDNYITFNPLLPEVVGASLLPAHVVAPLRQLGRGVDFRMVNVTGIDFARREIEYIGEGSGRIAYDQLVIACGQGANLGIVRGMARYALPLKTLGDALFLRNRIIVRLEQAALQPDREARGWLTSFVVVGGGFSGVETAGEIADFLRASLRYYPNIAREDVRVVLLHGGDRLLPELAPSLSRFALARLLGNGIDVRLQARAALVDDRAVQLDNGERVAAGTVICTIGTAPHPLLGALPLPLQRGRIATAPDMSVPGFDGVWAIGDCAAVPNAHDQAVCAPTAQFANRQAKQLARNIRARLAGRATRPFRYRPAGQLATVGHNRAVADLYGLRIGGFIAWLLWRGVYLLKIPTLARKVRLYLEWNWAMFFPPDIVHLGYRRTMPAPPRGRDAQDRRAA